MLELTVNGYLVQVVHFIYFFTLINSYMKFIS